MIDRAKWDQIDANNQVSFNTILQTLAGIDIKDGSKRLESDKLFRSQLLAILGSIAIGLCIQNQLELAKNEPNIMLAGTILPMNQKPL